MGIEEVPGGLRCNDFCDLKNLPASTTPELMRRKQKPATQTLLV